MKKQKTMLSELQNEINGIEFIKSYPMLNLLDLTPTQIRIIELVLSYQDNGRSFYMSNKNIGLILNLSVQSVKNSITILNKKEYLTSSKQSNYNGKEGGSTSTLVINIEKIIKEIRGIYKEVLTKPTIDLSGSTMNVVEQPINEPEALIQPKEETEVVIPEVEEEEVIDTPIVNGEVVTDEPVTTKRFKDELDEEDYVNNDDYKCATDFLDGNKTETSNDAWKDEEPKEEKIVYAEMFSLINKVEVGILESDMKEWEVIKGRKGTLKKLKNNTSQYVFDRDLKEVIDTIRMSEAILNNYGN